MQICKESLRLLRLARKKYAVNFEDPDVFKKKKKGEVHIAEWEHISELDRIGYVKINRIVHTDYGFEETTYSITPSGLAYLEGADDKARHDWITRGIAAISLVLSILTAAKQLGIL